MKDLTLVLTGGGMRCAWTGGFLYGLHEIGVIPKAIVASSGSLGSVMYFATGQIESIRRIFTEHLPGSQFISFSRISRVIDIDFLVDTVFQDLEPISWATIQESPIQIFAPIMSTAGHIKLFTNNEMSYEVLRASKALPVLYRKKVVLDQHLFTDYPFSPEELLHALPAYDRTIVVDVRTQNRILRFLGSLITRPKK